MPVCPPAWACKEPRDGGDSGRPLAALHTMITQYPTAQAQELADALDSIGSRHGATVFVSALNEDWRGDDYRRVTVDVTRAHWGQLRRELQAVGWQVFSEDSLIYDLKNGNYLIAEPNF